MMSIPDELILEYFKVYTEIPLEEIAEIEKMLETDPMHCKLQLAEEIVARYHGHDIGLEEREWFIDAFSKRKTPEDIPVIKVGCKTATAFWLARQCLPESESNSQIRRLFQQNGIKVNGNTVDPDQEIEMPVELTIGKRRWFKVIL